MEQPQHRQEVYQVLKDQLRNDKARSKILQISEMGLVEMTRKRDRESLMRYLCDPCPYCSGSGHIKSVSTVLAEIFRELKRVCQDKQRGSVTVYVHPDIEMCMKEDEHFNLKDIDSKNIRGGKDIESSSKIFMDVLNGEASNDQENVVCANASLAIAISKDISIIEAFDKAKESIMTKNALKCFNELINIMK